MITALVYLLQTEYSTRSIPAQQAVLPDALEIDWAGSDGTM